MTRGDADSERLKANISRTIGVALLLIALTEGAIAGVVTKVVQGDLDAGASEYLEFAQLYLSTFLLSGTLTAVVAVWEVPKLYGTQVSYWAPLWVLVGGAFLTNLPVASKGGTPLGFVFGALATFASYYGSSFVTDLITSVAGGLVVYLVVEYLQKRS